MDKRVILAVAGSGKSSTIIDKLNENIRAIVITYTDLNTKELKQRIINKFGYIPNGIKVYSYFSFIYVFCFRPICGYQLKTKGLVFLNPLPQHIQRSRKDCREHWMNGHNRLYSNRVAKLLIEADAIDEVIARIDKYFDLICFDEVQDFASNDFNFICKLVNSTKEVLLVGDFYQHTFDTSRDGSTRKNLYNNYEDYCRELRKVGFYIDENALSKSYRCSPTICDFISQEMKISINSHRTDNVHIRFIDDDREITSIFNDDSIVKLFYQKSDRYIGNTTNWGAVKGTDGYKDVCVVLNPNTSKAYRENKLHELSATTLNKLYVACSRPNGNLYFIDEKRLKAFIK